MKFMKDASVEANTGWKAAGKSQYPPLHLLRQKTTRLRYRKRMKGRQNLEIEIYTNDLHEALFKSRNSSVTA